MQTGAPNVGDSRAQFPPAEKGAVHSFMEVKLAWFAAVIVAIAAAAIYIWISDWPPGTHADEDKKVAFILSGVQDFNHPLLLLQSARVANYILGYDDPETVLRLGRVISALFGGLVVLATFVLSRLVLAPATAVAAAAAVAATPLIVFHATFLKEDVYFTGPAILGLAGLLVLVERPSRRHALAVGLAFGLAVSAKYVAALLLAYVIAIILIASRGHMSLRLRDAGLVILSAVLVLCAINAPALLDYRAVLPGLNFELSHVVTGHDVRMPIWLTGGVMHLRDSLIPGLGLPLLVVGLAGLSAPFINRAKRKPLLIVAGAALLWYMTHEISPLKPYPNVERYMLPLGPLLVVLGAAFLETAIAWFSARYSALVASIVVLLCAVPAAYLSHGIAKANAHDPRRVVPRILAHVGSESRYDPYTLYRFGADDRPRTSRSPRIVVTSSFWYERFGRYGGDSTQSPEIRRLHDRYFVYAFKKPYLELSSGGPSFGFLNPVIRIVALDEDLDHLVTIGQAVIEVDPHIQISIGP